MRLAPDETHTGCLVFRVDLGVDGEPDELQLRLDGGTAHHTGVWTLER